MKGNVPTFSAGGEGKVEGLSSLSVDLCCSFDFTVLSSKHAA